MQVFLKSERRDGKLAVRHVFPTSGAKLDKIVSRERFNEDWAEADNNPNRKEQEAN